MVWNRISFARTNIQTQIKKLQSQFHVYVFSSLLILSQYYQRDVSLISLMIKLAFCKASSISVASRRLVAICGDSSKMSSFLVILYKEETSSDCKLSLTWLTKKCMIAFGTLSWMLLRMIKKYDLIKRSITSQSLCSRAVKRREFVLEFYLL